MAESLLSPTEFEQALRDKGCYYHIHHPYHIMMNQGEATKEQIQGWVANRFYYQVNIPLKDAAIMANCPDPATRRKWVQRILDHDGQHDDHGGIEAWLRLGEAVGLNRDTILSEKWCCQVYALQWMPMSILPAVRAGKKRPVARSPRCLHRQFTSHG